MTKYSVEVEGNYYIFTVSYDITALYLENRSNLFFATVDPLTGLFNRRYLNANMQLVSGKYTALIDLDCFKMINDREGHQVGDQILKEFAVFLRENLPSLLWSVRLGGDEFLLVFPDASLETQLQETLRSLRRQFETRYAQYDYLSFSYGLARATVNLGETMTLLDEAMYEDKARKRKRYRSGFEQARVSDTVSKRKRKKDRDGKKKF